MVRELLRGTWLVLIARHSMSVVRKCLICRESFIRSPMVWETRMLCLRRSKKSTTHMSPCSKGFYHHHHHHHYLVELVDHVFVFVLVWGGGAVGYSIFSCLNISHRLMVSVNN